MKYLDSWQFVLIACLSVGLAPYFPEPHVLGKLRWVAGGAVGMQGIDWLDLAMHGLPWLLLLRLLFLKLFFKNGLPSHG